MNTGAEQYFDSPRGILVLWTGILAGPLLWFANQQINYLLVGWACGSERMYLLHLVSLLCLAGTVAAGLLARRGWRALRSEAADVDALTPGRANFMALLGIAFSGLFAVVIF